MTQSDKKRGDLREIDLKKVWVSPQKTIDIHLEAVAWCGQATRGTERSFTSPFDLTTLLPVTYSSI